MKPINIFFNELKEVKKIFLFAVLAFLAISVISYYLPEQIQPPAYSEFTDFVNDTLGSSSNDVEQNVSIYQNSIFYDLVRNNIYANLYMMVGSPLGISFSSLFFNAYGNGRIIGDAISEVGVWPVMRNMLPYAPLEYFIMFFNISLGISLILIIIKRPLDWNKLKIKIKNYLMCFCLFIPLIILCAIIEGLVIINILT